MSWLTASVYGDQEVAGDPPNEDFEEVDAPTGFSEPPPSPHLITPMPPKPADQVVPTPVPKSPPPRPKVPKERKPKKPELQHLVADEVVQDLLKAVTKLQEHIALLHHEQIQVLRAIMHNTRK